MWYPTIAFPLQEAHLRLADGVFQQTRHCAQGHWQDLAGCQQAVGRGQAGEGARLVKGLVVLSLIVEIGLARLALLVEMAGLGGSGARADVGSLHSYMALGLMLCDT